MSDPKKVLIAAGVTIAVAVVASFGASSFMSSVDDGTADQSEEVEQVAESEEVQETKPAQETVWADSDSGDDGFGDDWGVNTSDSSSSSSIKPNSSTVGNDGESEPAFGDYGQGQPSSRMAGSGREGDGPIYRAPSQIEGKSLQQGGFDVDQ